MLDISPAPTNIYHLNYIPCSASINIGDLDHIVVEYNIGKSDISCWLYHSYIHYRQHCWYLPKTITYLLGIFLGISSLVKLCFLCENITFNLGITSIYTRFNEEVAYRKRRHPLRRFKAVYSLLKKTKKSNLFTDI